MLSELPRGGHLEKNSTLRYVQYLLPTGLGHTRRGGITYNRDGKYHSMWGPHQSTSRNCPESCTENSRLRGKGC